MAVLGSASPLLKVAAPYPDYFEDMTASAIHNTGNVNCSAALVELLGLEGKFIIPYLGLAGLTLNEDLLMRIKVDGQVLIYEQFAAPNSIFNLWDSGDRGIPPMACRSSFSLEVKTVADTAISLNYRVVPLL